MAQRAGKQRSIKDLKPEERDLLSAAQLRLREAALRYEPFIARQPVGPEAPPLLSLEAAKAAQDELIAAEDSLWELREKLLGWQRPAGSPRATQITEWIIEDEEDE